MVWNGVIVDGHNRYEICTALGIEYETVNKDFETREDAKIWIIKNQLSRRNISSFTRVELAGMLEEEIAAKAKKNIQIRKGNQPGATCQNSDNMQTIDTKKEIAEIAGAVGIAQQTINDKLKVLPDIDTCPKPVKVHALFEEEDARWHQQETPTRKNKRPKMCPLKKQLIKSPKNTMFQRPKLGH